MMEPLVQKNTSWSFMLFTIQTLINFLLQVKNRKNRIQSIFIVQVISKPNTDTTEQGAGRVLLNRFSDKPQPIGSELC